MTLGVHKYISIVPILDTKQVIIYAVPSQALGEIFLGFVEILPEILLVEHFQVTVLLLGKLFLELID